MTWQPFSAAEVDQVFTTESRQKDERLFTLTHSPMRRILVTHNRVGLSNGDFIGEQRLLQVIQEGQPGASNRVWFVVGETGSGKSELCQWLEYHLRDTHVPIHISRRQANLTGILDVLHGHLHHVPRQAAPSVPAEVLTEHLRMYLQLRAHREGQFQHAVQDLLPWCPLLVQRLYGPSRPEHGLLEGLPDLPAGFPLEAWVMGAAREVLGVQSLEGLLRGVVEIYQAQNKRPVLLLEDITTLGFLRDDLLDYIFDLSAPGFDAVIGLTTGFEQSNLSQGVDLAEMAYVRDRLSARFQLSNAAGETFFLSQPQDLYELVRRYLACLTLPPSTSPSAQHPGFDGLYPFTPTMVGRLYLHLVESGNLRQTPRNLLDAVIKPALTQAQPPHVTLFQPHPYLSPPSITFYRQQLPDDLAALFYWHGVADGDVITVPEEVAQAFGYAELPVVRGFQQPVATTNLFHSPTAGADPRAEWQSALAELQGWQGGADSFPKRQHVKRGFERLARMLGEPRQVGHPALNALSADPLEFTRGGEMLPIYLPDSGDVLPEHWPSIHLPRTTASQFLEECLNYAFTSPQHVEVLADPGGTREVVEGHLRAFQNELRSHLSHLLGLPYEDVVLGLWWLCQHLTLARPLASKETQDLALLLTYDTDAQTTKVPWQGRRTHQILHRTSHEITALRSSYRALFISVFHHRDDIIDAELLSNRWAQFDPTSFVQSLASLSLKRVLSAPFRQKRSLHTLHALIRPAQEYCVALLAYPAADADDEALGLALGHLEDAVTGAEDFDRVCREIERVAHRLGLAVQAPPTSHGWKHTRWEQLHREAGALLEELSTQPPLTCLTVRRAWLEFLSQSDPLLWLTEIRAFMALVNNMMVARHGGARISPRAITPYAVRLGDLERLQGRLQKHAQELEQVGDDLHQQLMASVHALSQAAAPEVQARATEALTTPPQSKDEHLQVACDLLTRSVPYLSLAGDNALVANVTL